jgi:tetratricopeptide (TPR) repeat protein
LAQAHSNLLSAYLTLGEFKKAEEHYNAAMQLDPNMYELHFNYGLLQSQQGKNSEAADAFRRAIEINPFYAEAHNNLAFILANEGKLEQAIDHFLLAIKNQPNYRDAHFNLGQILLTQGKARDAIPHFIETIVARDEQTPLFLFTLAKAHFQMGELREGMSRAEEARQQAKSLSQLSLLAEIDQFLKQHRTQVP